MMGGRQIMVGRT